MAVFVDQIGTSITIDGTSLTWINGTMVSTRQTITFVIEENMYNNK